MTLAEFRGIKNSVWNGVFCVCFEELPGTAALGSNCSLDMVLGE